MHSLTPTPIDKLDKPTNRERIGFVGLSSLSTGVVINSAYATDRCGSERRMTVCMRHNAQHRKQVRHVDTSAITNALDLLTARPALVRLEQCSPQKTKVLPGPNSRGAKRRGFRLVLKMARGLYFKGDDR
jgi:hypothetical protein